VQIKGYILYDKMLYYIYDKISRFMTRDKYIVKQCEYCNKEFKRLKTLDNQSKYVCSTSCFLNIIK